MSGSDRETMARLLGIGFLLWSIYTAVNYAVLAAPSAPEVAVESSDDPTTQRSRRLPSERSPSVGPRASGGAATDNLSASQPSSSRTGTARVARSDRAFDLTAGAATTGDEGDELTGGDLAFADERARAVAADSSPGVYQVVGSRRVITSAIAVGDMAPLGPLAADTAWHSGLLRPAFRHEQGEIAPGLYMAEATGGPCNFELWRMMIDGQARVIGEDFLQSGRLLVVIDDVEPDWFVSSSTCSPWQPWEPRPDPTAPAADGDYAAGDLAPGIWVVPDDCLWEQVVSFRGGELRDVVASAQGPRPLIVDETTIGVRIRSCVEPITLIH